MSAFSRPAHLRVLVVDDCHDTTATLAMLLAFRGHEVQTANDGRTALNHCREFRPDVVLLDIGLPDVNGWEVAGQIRAVAGCADVLIIAVSGFARDEDRERSRLAGCDHHLVKPVDFADLERLLPAAAVQRGPQRNRPSAWDVSLRDE